MTGVLSFKDEVFWIISDFISFDICHGLGEPCDYFELSFAFEQKMLQKLSRVNRFKAYNGDDVVFSGVVDEYTININENGSIVTLSGRSLAALLLDNEAEAATYATVTLDAVLQNHVGPYGISVSKRKDMPPLYMFAVSSGSSQWSVLKRYCRYAGNITPRFSKEGALVLSEDAGKSISLLDEQFSSAKFIDTRYGSISEVLVKNRVTGASYIVENKGFKARGGCARRVITVPKTASYDSMRYTGQFQISEASLGKRYAKLCVNKLFAAFPMDRVAVNYPELGLNGTYKVCQSQCFLSESGYGTYLSLEV